MKKLIAIVVTSLSLIACTSQKIYSDYDYSFSRSGGKEPIYENLLIKDNTVHYSLEGQGNKVKKSFKITTQEIEKINSVLKENRFRHILEDHKKLYDNVAVSINVKKGDQNGSKTDASLIMPKDKKNWDSIVGIFQEIIDKNVKK